MAKKTGRRSPPVPNDHNVSVDHDLLMQAQKTSGQGTYVEVVELALRLLVKNKSGALVAGLAGRKAIEKAAQDSPMRAVGQMSESDSEVWLQTYSDAQTALVQALAKLKSKKASLDTTTPQKKILEIQILDVNAELSLVKEMVNAILAGSQKMMVEPTPEIIGAISGLINTLSKETAKAKKGDGIINAAQGVIEALKASRK